MILSSLEPISSPYINVNKFQTGRTCSVAVGKEKSCLFSHGADCAKIRISIKINTIKKETIFLFETLACVLIEDATILNYKQFYCYV